jgi:hypothetical protein
LLALVCAAWLVFPLLAGSASADEAPASEPQAVPPKEPQAVPPKDWADRAAERAAVDPAPGSPRSFDDRVGYGLSRAEWALGLGRAAIHDVLLLRPMGTAATVAGFGMFLVSSPLTLATWKVVESWETFVVPPAQYTFTRPIGKF